MGSVSDADQGVAQVPLGLSQGVTGRVLPREPGEQGLQGAATAQSLEIANQGKGAILVPAPAESHGSIELELQQHRPALTAEFLQVSMALGAEAHRTQTGLEQIRIAEHRWQDGEMGHGHHDRFRRR